jgi:hypothetical protein
MASGGPTDPNVVLIDFIADRIELWSSMHGVTDPLIIIAGGLT